MRIFPILFVFFFFLSNCSPHNVEIAVLTTVPTETATPTILPTATPRPTDPQTPIPAATETAMPSLTPTPDTSLSPIILEGMTCANPNLCFEMTVPEETGKDFYFTFLDALAKSYANRKYWRELGLTDLTGKGLLSFLRKSTGPDGRNYYLPAETKMGTRLMLIMPYSMRGTNTFVKFKPVPEAYGQGITVDGIRFVIYAPGTWNNSSIGIREFVKSLPVDMAFSLLNYNSIWGDRNEVGLNITSDGRLILVMGAWQCPESSIVNGPQIYYTVGCGKDGNFRPGVEPKIATALALTYISGLRDFPQINRRTNSVYKDIIERMCVNIRNVCYGVLVYDVEEEDNIFAPR